MSVTVLAYHAVGDSEDAPYTVTAATLAAHLDALRRWRFRFLDVDDVIAVVHGERTAPRRGVLLSFDDGYADLRDTVGPLLREHDAPAIAFVVADLLGRTNAWDVARGTITRPLLDAAGLRSLARSDVEAGAHSRTHPDLTSLEAQRLRHELSRTALIDAGLPRPRAFSYPYGAFDPTVVDAVREAGYEVAFTVRPGIIHGGVSDPLTLPRVQIHQGDGVARLALKLAAAHAIGSGYSSRP